MKSNRNPSHVRPPSRTLLVLALMLGVLGIARVSHAQISAELRQDLMTAGDTSGLLANATQGELATAISVETGSANGNSYTTLNSDIAYIFSPSAGLSAATEWSFAQVVPESAIKALSPASGAEAQTIAANSTTNTAMADAGANPTGYLECRDESAYLIGSSFESSGSASLAALMPSVAAGIASNDASATDDAAIAYNAVWAYYEAGNYTLIPTVYEQVAAIQGSVANQVTIATSLVSGSSSYYNAHVPTEVTTAVVGIELVALTTNSNTASTAASVTGSFVTALPSTYAPLLAQESATQYISVATAIAYVATSDAPSQAAAIATDVAGVSSTISGALLSGTIASLSSLTDVTRETVAVDVLTVDGSNAGIAAGPNALGVAAAVAPYVTVAADKAQLAEDISSVLVTASNSNVMTSGSIASAIAATLPDTDSTINADVNSVAFNAAWPLYEKGGAADSDIPGVYEAVAATYISGSAPNLTEQVYLVTSIYNQNNYTNLPGVALTTATGVAQISVTEAGGTAAGAQLITIGSAYSTGVPAYAAGFATIAGASANGNVSLSGSIGAAIDEVAAVDANVTLSGQVALAVAVTSTPSVTGTLYNNTLYGIAQVFGAVTGTSGGQINPTSNISVAQNLAGLAVFTPSNENTLMGETVDNDVIAAISSAFTNNKAFAVSNPNSLSNIESVLNNLISQYPENAADILGSVIATSTVAANNASALKTYVDSIVDNSTLLHDIFGAASLSISQETALANNDILAALQIATDEEVTALGLTVMGQNAGGLNYNGYNGNGTGLTPDETPVVDM